MASRPRVVVTGIGVVTSIGIGVDAFWAAILAGTSGIGPVESFDSARYAQHIGGEVKHFDPRPFIERLPATTRWPTRRTTSSMATPR